MHTTHLPTPLSHALGASDSYHDSPKSYARGEQALWAAVITQALMDAASRSAKNEARKDKTRARDWLATITDDFQDVCDLAGLDPSYVASRAERAIAGGCQWRLPAGQGWRHKAASAGKSKSVTEVA